MKQMPQTFDSIKASLKRDLEFIASGLEKARIVRDGSIIRNAHTSLVNNGNEWNYSIPKLIIKHPQFSAIRNIRPTGTSEIFVEASISVKGDFSDDFGIANGKLRTNIKVILKGKTSRASQQIEPICCLHLDTEDKTLKEREDDNSREDYFHPFYHVQYGGNTIRDNGEGKNEATYYGEMLILDAPRLLHPPMDAVLSIDFILSNFLPISINKNLRNDSNYSQVVRSSQKKLWKPFFALILSTWDTNPNSLSIRNLIPQMLVKG